MVHASDSGEKQQSSSHESGGPRKEILHRRKERKHAKPPQRCSSSPSPPVPDAGDLRGTKKPRVKRVGKPSRRWLASEIDRLFRDNVRLASQLKAKEDVEKSLLGTVSRLEAEVKEAGGDGTEKDDNAVECLRLRNKQLSQDVFLMKNVVVRLNAELERYHDKLRSLQEEPGDGERKTNRTLFCSPPLRNPPRPEAGWIRRGELTALVPLLEAYDEALAEKERLLSDYKTELDSLSGRTKEVLRENRELRERIDETEKKGEISYSEWLVVRKESAATREQNELLVRQVKLGQSKFNDLRSAFQAKLDECCRERDTATDKLQELRAETFILKGRFSALLDEYNRMKETTDSRIPQTVHVASINECKRLFEELKTRYDGERDDLLKRLSALEGIRPEYEGKMAALTAEREQLRFKLAESESSVSRANQKVEEATGKVEKCERTKEELRRQLAGSVAFSGELVREQEGLLRRLEERTQEAELGGRLAKRLDSLKTQIQGVEREADEQMGVLDRELRQKAGSLRRMKDGQAKEIEGLRKLIKEQEAVIVRLETEKKKSQQELEVVWNAATAHETE